MALLPEPAAVLSKSSKLVDHQRQARRNSTEAAGKTDRLFRSGRKVAPIEAQQIHAARRECKKEWLNPSMHIVLATSRNQPSLTSSDSVLRDELENRGA